MYRLGQLVRPSGVAGRCGAAAGPAETALVAEWLGAFHDEAQPHAAVQDWRASAQRRVAAGEVHLWYVDGAPVSLAAVTAPAAGVARGRRR